MGGRGASSKSSSSNSIRKMTYEQLNQMTSKELEKFAKTQSSKKTLETLARLDTPNMIDIYNNNLSNVRNAHRI